MSKGADWNMWRLIGSDTHIPCQRQNRPWPNNIIKLNASCCQTVKNTTRGWQRGSPWYVQSKSHTSITFLSLSVVSYVCQSMKLIFLQTLGGRNCEPSLTVGLCLSLTALACAARSPLGLACRILNKEQIWNHKAVWTDEVVIKGEEDS